MYWKVCLEIAVNSYERLLPIFLKPPAWTVGSLPHVSPGKPFIKPFSLKEAAETGQGGRTGRRRVRGRGATHGEEVAVGSRAEALGRG